MMLADGGLDYPSLHGPRDIQNREGLVDAVLHGASVSRVSRPVDGYFLITTGTPVASGMAVVRDARWHRLTAGMAGAGVTLVLYLLDGEPCTPAFLGSASDIIVLGTEGETPTAIRDLDPLVRAVTRPAMVDSPVGVDAVATRVSDPPEKKGGRGRTVWFILLAIIVAVLLGWFLSTGMG